MTEVSQQWGSTNDAGPALRDDTNIPTGSRLPHEAGLSSPVVDAALLGDLRDRLGQESGPRVGRTRRSQRHRTTDAAAVRDALSASGRVLGSDALRELTRAAHAEVAGAGPLQPLLDLPNVTDVLVNTPNDVWVDRGGALEHAPVNLGTPATVRALAGRLAALAGQRLDDAAPICDGRLPDGTRLHAVIEPISSHGACISLRVLRQADLTFEALVRGGSLPEPWVRLVRGLVDRRANVLVSGGTGTGKTTFLAALLGLVPPGERIITVEEAQELAPAHPHVVPLVARRANVEGAGAVELTDLVRAALRMRPDRLVVGECRGAEVREVLLAMNTGHDGGLATIHANAVEHVPARLEALAALAGMSREATGAGAAAAIDVVLQMARSADGNRFVSQVGVADSAGGEFVVAAVARWNGTDAQPEVLEAERYQAVQERWGTHA
ncbi:MAG: TadA family conjugal transfer-associated ATPase [Cellulomonadaceae bacterium]|nr:TadA family conjugal transfer-associated ATPase [Cellulomonadaceae bacterium]